MHIWVFKSSKRMNNSIEMYGELNAISIWIVCQNNITLQFITEYRD